MSASPAELTASAVISMIAGGAYPREVVLTIARGFLPLPQEDLIAVLAYLITSGDAEIAAAARAAMADVPTRIVVSVAASETTPAEHLALLLRANNDPVVLEAAIRNRQTPDEAVVELAGRADATVQEVIVINQARILRAPQILDALLSNARLSPDARRRALETREEFFEKVKAREEAEQAAAEQAAAEAAAEAEGQESEISMRLDAIADLLVLAEGDTSQTPPNVALTETEKKDEPTRAIWAQLQNMTIAQRLLLAFRGDKMIRMILVRERNRIVATAAIRNPRITENEVESIAGMRNVEEEVLRIIGTRRDWMQKYPIMHNLIRNPKAPGGAEFVPEMIHNRSGAGSDLLAVDLNKDGAMDVVTSNNRGTFIFWGTVKKKK